MSLHAFNTFPKHKRHKIYHYVVRLRVQGGRLSGGYGRPEHSVWRISRHISENICLTCSVNKPYPTISVFQLVRIWEVLLYKLVKVYHPRKKLVPYIFVVWVYRIADEYKIKRIFILL